jgi:parallel beta-helix repeat protein
LEIKIKGRKKMDRNIYLKRLFIGLVISILLLCAIPHSLSTNTLQKSISNKITWIVDNEGDGDFINIQDAIDASDEGDIIEVYSGTYEENIWVYIDDLEISGIDEEYLNGGDTGKPIIDGTDNDNVVEIRKTLDEEITDVTISGFTIRNSGIGNAGIKIYYASDIKMSECDITQNDRGILATRLDTINVIENEIYDNIFGIYLENSDNNDIIDNTFTANSENGIRLEYASNNDISQNTVTDCGIGCYFVRSIGNEITSNEFENNEINADFLNCFNYWRSNYWDDNVIPKNIYVIWGSFKPFAGISWLILPIPQFDWSPSF